MQIILVRHGDAENRITSDAARALTAKGHQQAQAVGKFLRARDFNPTFFFSSPYRRAKETAEIISRNFDDAKGNFHEDDRLQCGCSPSSFLALINDHAKSHDDVFLIVGHNPDCAEIVEFFTGAVVDFKKAAVAIIELFERNQRGGALTAFIPPKLLG